MFLPVTEVFFNTLKLVVSPYKIFLLIITWDQRGISTGAKGTRWIPTVTSLNHPVHVWRVYADIEIYVVELCDMWASCSAPLSIHLELPFPCIVSAPSSSLAAVPYSLLHLIILRLNVSLLFVALSSSYFVLLSLSVAFSLHLVPSSLPRSSLLSLSSVVN